MATLRETSTCSNGIELNDTTTYTIITLPQGVFTNSGFTDDGSFYYDTNAKQFVVIIGGVLYKINEVNFTSI
jgi:hypothetical protein